jgi:hypothetical protein
MPAVLPRPRLLACDIDGTLLDPAGRLRPAVRDAVRLVAQSGVHVVLATGRSPWAGIAEIVGELGLHGPQITSQGAVISDATTGRVHRLQPLPATVYRDGLLFAEALGIDPVIGLIDGMAARREPADVDFVASAASLERLRLVDDLEDLADAEPIRLYLPTGLVRHQHVLAAASVWFADRATLVWSDRTGVELLAPATNKGAAVSWMATQLGIGSDEVAAVGDAPNDTSMLRSAGRSAAMGGAPVQVLAAADVMVPSSAADGIVDAFAWFFPDLADELGRPAIEPSTSSVGEARRSSRPAGRRSSPGERPQGAPPRTASAAASRHD